MENTKIDRCDHSLNPIIGCKHWCSYCYAKRLVDRFKMIPDFTGPQFFPQRLRRSKKWKPWDKVFMWSMSDIFWERVPAEWIDQIIKFCSDNEDVYFMFLTKNPKRYSECIFPSNCRLWTTINSNADINRLKQLCATPIKESWPWNKLFVSIEPLLWKCDWLCFEIIDLVIVGAMTWPNAVEPRKEWIDSIKAENIHYKWNIQKFLPS